jgi:hypothetical protein
VTQANNQYDVVAKVFKRVMDALPSSSRTPDVRVKIIISSLLDAADRGVTDEDVLTDTALAAATLYEQGNAANKRAATPKRR